MTRTRRQVIVEEEFKYEFNFDQINKHIYEGIQKFANPRDEVKKKRILDVGHVGQFKIIEGNDFKS